VPEESFFWTSWCKGDITGRHTNNPAGHHSIWTNQQPTSLIPPFSRRMPSCRNPLQLGTGIKHAGLHTQWLGYVIIMAAVRTLYFAAVVSIFLCPPYGIGQAIIFSSCGLFFFYLPFFPRLFSAVADWMSAILPHMGGLSANLGCSSETCCTRLAEIQDAKNRYVGTIAQLCRAISSQLRHRPISKIGQKPVKQQYLSHMSSQYGELRPTSG